eukprot:758018-Hanusia_phi.AAC.6
MMVPWHLLTDSYGWSHIKVNDHGDEGDDDRDDCCGGDHDDGDVQEVALTFLQISQRSETDAL